MNNLKTSSFKKVWLDIQYNNEKYSAQGELSHFSGYKFDSGEGEYIEWEFANEQLKFENSAFGLINTYYYADKQRIILATDITDIIKLIGNQPIDQDAFNSFLHLGYYLGDETPFSTIKCIPRDSELTWTKSGVCLTSLSRTKTPTTYQGSYQQAQQEYLDIFSDVITKFDTHEEKLAMPLSGGRDSRHILLELLKQNKNIDLITTCACFPPKHNDDLEIAKQLCNALDIPHTTAPLGADLFEDELKKNYSTSFCADEHAWILPLHEYFKTEEITLIFDGIAGDILSAGLFLTPKRIKWRKQEDWLAIAEDIAGSTPNYHKFLGKKLLPLVNRNGVVNKIAKELEALKAYENPIAEYYLRNRTRREIGLSTWNIMGEGRVAIAPFLMSKLYHFLASLPFEFVEDNKFHTKTIQIGYPEFAKVPFSEGKKYINKEYKKAIRAYNYKALKYVINSSNNGFLACYQFRLKLVRMWLQPSYLSDRLDILNKAIYYTHIAKYMSEE